VVLWGGSDCQIRKGTPDWSGGTLRFEVSARDFAHDPDETVTGVIPGSDLNGLRVGGTAGRRTLGFNPDGLTAGTNQTLHVCSLHRPEWRKIIINKAGRPRTSRPETGQICPP